MLTRERLEATLGFKVLAWPGQYVTAFTHKSAVGRDGISQSFEKLEFLGDAVLGFVVGKYLYDAYPDANEGFLTQMRSKLVSSKALSGIAMRMGLSELIIMSPKALRSGFNTNPRILEDVFESLVGAIFLDGGMVAARSFVLDVFSKHVDPMELAKNTNYKDILMQYCQARAQPLPTYASQPSERGFDVRADACGAAGFGSGRTKRAAEQLAAKYALMRLGVSVD